MNENTKQMKIWATVIVLVMGFIISGMTYGINNIYQLETQYMTECIKAGNDPLACKAASP